MGLAASQARLLFITSRQNDVSAKMQRVSNDTMVLARDEDEVITKYNKMLNATKLELKDGVDLSYDALMGSTAINNRGSMSIITNSDGRVVLSTADISKYGLPQEGDKKAIAEIYPDVKDFIKKAEPDVTTQTEIINALSSLDATDKKGGNGSTTELTEDDIAKIKKFKSSYGDYPSQETIVTVSEALRKAGAGNYSAASTHYRRSQATCDINKDLSGYNLLDLLNGKAGTDLHIATDGDRRGVPRDIAKKNMGVLLSQFKELIMNAFGFKKGGTVDQELSKFVDSMAEAAYGWNDKMGSKIEGSTDNNKLSDFCWTWTSSTGHNHNDHMNVNCQTIVTAMLKTALSNSQEGYSNGLPNVDSMITIVQNSKGYTKPDYDAKLKSYLGCDDTKLELAVKYLAPTSGSSGSGSATGVSTNKQKAQCYQTLYNALYNNGWSAENTDSIAENLKNGTYKVNNDILANNSDLYEEVADKDTQAKAESYWNVEMKKIQRKEKILDQELTKLQTEYSSLSTDYESVKSIISQNVTRSFQYCQNG